MSLIVPDEDRPVVLYDGVCGFCNHAVRFLLRIDRRGALRFAALQGPFAEGVLARHPHLASLDTVVFVDHPGRPTERVTVRSAAALRALEEIGGPWRAARALRIVPAPVRDVFYDGFAAIRYRVFGRLDACPVPSPEVRARFVDGGVVDGGVVDVAQERSRTTRVSSKTGSSDS